MFLILRILEVKEKQKWCLLFSNKKVWMGFTFHVGFGLLGRGSFNE